MTPKTVFSFAAGPAGAMILGTLSLPLTAWIFDQSDIGRIAMLFVAIRLASLLFTFGLDQSYARYYHYRSNKEGLFLECMSPGIVILCCALTALLFFSPELLSLWLFDVPSAKFSVAIAILMVSQLVTTFLLLKARMEEKGSLFSIAQVLPKFVMLAVLICGYIIAGINQFAFLLAAHTFALTLGTLYLLSNVRVRINAISKAQELQSNLKEHLRFGLPLVIAGAAYWGLTMVDKIFLSEMSGYEQVGLYAVATSFANGANLIKIIFATVWAPVIYSMTNHAKAAAFVSKISLWIAILVLAMTAATGALSWVTHFILPKEYDAVPVLLILCILPPLLYTYSESTAVGINLSNRTGFSFLAAFISFVANCIGNYILVPIKGAEGAAISTALSFALFALLRTEFSSNLWEQFQRLKSYQYLSVTLLLVLATPWAYRAYGPNMLHAAWGLVGFGFVVAHLQKIKQILNEIQSWRNTKGKQGTQ